jgi:hypothetical protein
MRQGLSRVPGMDAARLNARKIAEKALANDGELSLALLLQHLVPVGRLRALAKQHGLTPKGGFRIEKAPASVLAPLLAEQRAAERLDEVVALLLPPAKSSAASPAAGRDRTPSSNGTAREENGTAREEEDEPDEHGEADDALAAADPAPTAESSSLLALRDAEVSRLKRELERAREAANRAQARETQAERALATAEEDLLRLRRALTQQLEAASASPAPAADRGDRDTERLLRELESEREGFLAADEALRRQLAFTQSRVRQLEDEVRELHELVPKGRRRSRPAAPPAAEERRFRLPRFAPGFYKSLDGKDRRAVERAVHAILLFCTEGHAYPGLEVKQLGGQDTWSLRASLGLRVYFRQLPDGDIELLQLADREEQHTALRRLKGR